MGKLIQTDWCRDGVTRFLNVDQVVSIHCLVNRQFMRPGDDADWLVTTTATHEGSSVTYVVSESVAQSILCAFEGEDKNDDKDEIEYVSDGEIPF